MRDIFTNGWIGGVCATLLLMLIVLIIKNEIKQ